jgi:excisionase family DNA binding protein
MLQRGRLRNLGEYLTVKEAAAFLGVTTKTLRNWDSAGKLRPHRHPLNGYRLYRLETLQALLAKAARATDGGHP